MKEERGDIPQEARDRDHQIQIGSIEFQEKYGSPREKKKSFFVRKIEEIIKVFKQ